MKHKKVIFIIGIVLIAFLYLFLRLYKLNSLINFGLDQGIHLLETKSMFDLKKISLVGPMVSSKSFMGRNFFIGANYYYVLGIIALIGAWNPLIITSIFIFIELAFYLLLIMFIKRRFNSFWALLTFVAITFSPYLIVHSRFFWNPHLLIPLSISFLLFSEKYFLKKEIKYLFLMAFLWGFAFACHYSAIFWGLFIILILIKSKQIKKIKLYLVIILGFVLGNLPFFIFEVRHGFYNIKTIFYVFTHSNQSSELTSHYFIFPLLIFVLFGLLIFLSRIKNKKNRNIALILVVILSFLSQSKVFSGYYQLNNFPNWNYLEQKKVVELITKDGCPKNFNVASTVQGDSRSYNLRFLLATKGCKVMGVEEYPKAEKLFLVAPINRAPEKENIWEVSSLGKFKINEEIKISSNIIFYELEKIQNSVLDK